MGYDQAELQRLEGVYLSSRDAADIGPLYSELLVAGRTILFLYSEKKGIRLRESRRQEVVHDAATRLLEMYLKYDDQKSIPLLSRMYKEVIFQLHNRKQIKYDQCGGLYPTIPVKQENEPGKDLALFVCDISQDCQVDGKRIVVDLYLARYYKWAILAIEKYTSRQWIREHAVELRTIYLLTRSGK
jgi:hypothetical protein